MDNREYDPKEVWDEYRWERYLQQNDRRCDQFARLLEQHLRHPQRDRIIAREMGWSHLLEAGEPVDAEGRGSLFLELIDHMLAGDELADDEMESMDGFGDDDDDFGSFPEGDLGFGTPSLFGPQAETEFSGPEAALRNEGFMEDEDIPFGEDEDDEDDLSSHPLCDLAATYQAWLERLFQEEPELLLDPAAARLATYSAICGAKICTALEGDEFEDLGMTIAYLKRGLKAINTVLETHSELARREVLSKSRAEELLNRVFRIRDGIVELMGYYRMEWMRRIDE